MSDPHRSFRENLASGRHTLTDMKTNSLTGLQNGTYVKHHLRVTPYAQHIFKCWHDNWAVRALWDFSDWWHSPCSQLLLPLWPWSPSYSPSGARVHLLPFGAHLIMLEAVAFLALEGGTRKGHASQKSLPGNIMVTTAIILEKNKLLSWKQIPQKIFLLSITYSCLKQTTGVNQLLEYLTYLDPQCNIPPLGNTASNSSATKKSPSPCWLHNSRVIDLQETPMYYKHQQKLEKPDPLVKFHLP